MIGIKANTKWNTICGGNLKYDIQNEIGIIRTDRIVDSVMNFIKLDIEIFLINFEIIKLKSTSLFL